MKNTILFGLLFCWCISAFAQEVTVKDKKTNVPLEMVTLASTSPNAYATTNAEGKADIKALRGADKIEVRLMGYKSRSLSFAEMEKLNFEISLEQAQFNLDQVVVSATRWNQSGRDIPSKIASITPEEIALQNPQTAADLLGTSGEVYIQKSQQGGGSPVIRGFSTNRLLLTIDGVRMNTAIFRSGNIQNVISLDPFTIENTEVLFGPGSVIYGSDAIGGVMSFNTLTPQLSTTDKALVNGKAVTRYATANNEKTVHFDVNVGGKKWSSVSSFTYTDYDDLRMGSDGPDEYLRHFYVERKNDMDVVVENDNPEVQVPSGYSQYNIMQKVRFKASEKWDFQYGFHYSTTSDYPRYDRLIRTRDGLTRSAEWYYGPQKWMMNNLNISHKSNRILFDELSIRLAFQNFEESRIDRDFNDNIRKSRVEQVDAYSVNVDFTKSIGSSSQLYYGLEAILNEVDSKGENEDILSGNKFTGPSRYPNASWESYAAYLTYQQDVSEKLMLQAGARYNHFALNADFSNNLAFYPFPERKSSINDASLTGSMGFVYKPSNSLSVIGNVSTGFRAPNVDDMGKVFDSEPGAIVVPNSNLEAEYAYNAEIGLAKIFSDVVKVDFTAYYTLLENAMVRRDFQLNGRDSIVYDGEVSKVQAIQNAALAKVYGVQAGIEIKLPYNFSFFTSYNYQKGEEELDNGSVSPSRHAVPMFGISRLTYSKNKLQVQLYATYSGERSFEDMPEEEKGKTFIYASDENGNPYSPSWYTLNLKSMYNFNKTFSLSAGIENITDQRYRPYSSGIVAAGRNYIVSLRANF